MIPEQPKKVYYYLSELPKLLKVQSSKIRYWESEKLIKSFRADSGERKYTAKMVDRMRKIIDAKKTGHYTLKGIKELVLKC